MGLLATGLTQHLWSPKEDGRANVPWKQGDWVGIDFCGRLLPLSKKAECYTQHERPYPVPAQQQVDASLNDMFKRLLFDERNIRVVLVVDGRSNPLKHRFANGETQSRVAEARNILKQATDARADMAQYANFNPDDWAAMRETVKEAQKTLALYNVALFAMVQDWIARTKRSDRVFFRIAAYESDPQLVHMLRDGVIDYLVSDDSDIMCFGAARQWSG